LPASETEISETLPSRNDPERKKEKKKKKKQTKHHAFHFGAPGTRLSSYVKSYVQIVHGDPHVPTTFSWSMRVRKKKHFKLKQHLTTSQRANPVAETLHSATSSHSGVKPFI
jgi:hypothetical protein